MTLEFDALEKLVPVYNTIIHVGRDQFCPQVLTLVASAASANRAGGFDLAWNTCGISNGDGWFVVKQAVDKRKLRKDHAMSLQGTLLYIINSW